MGKKEITRRQFLKILGGATLGSAAIMAGCKHPSTQQAEGFTLGEIPTDKMSYRTNSHGDKGLRY